ncbi:hypothetical protein ACLB2K_025384 [Fragaria x ananassa]
MKVIAAYLLARLGGNTNPSADDLKRICGAVASGKEKLALVPSSDDTSAAAPAAVVEETEEEKVEKEEEEEDDFDGPFSLFGPDN